MCKSIHRFINNDRKYVKSSLLLYNCNPRESYLPCNLCESNEHFICHTVCASYDYPVPNMKHNLLY